MRRVLDWWFRDRATGRVVVGQFPNPPLWAFLAALLVGRLAPTGSAVRSVADVIAGVALAWWGVDELARGVNPWRRLLGAVALGFVAARVLRWT